MSAHKGWIVTVPVWGGEAEIDTVFHDTDDAETVRRSLINHDGYDSGIAVYRDGAAPARLDWNGKRGARYRGQA